MKQLTVLFAIVISVVACNNQKKSAPETTAPQWELVWEDNFDLPGLPDTTVWNYETGYIRNNEAQFYTNARTENARVEDGNLIIEARKDFWEGDSITSASINTYGKKSM